jgi:hypothetical protein
MALFNDGPINDAADLQRYESSILNVTSTEGIDLGAKIVLAQQDVANEILLFLIRRMTLDEQALGDRRFRGVKDVVVTDPLRQWHVNKTLAFVYRDAYENQLNDRYQGKWNEYEALAKASQQTYFHIGVGVVCDPIPKAAAPELSAVPGTATGGSYYVAVSWVNVAGQEGTPSEFSQLVTSDGQLLVVAAGAAPENAAGWNVYVGISPGTARLQNAVPFETTVNWIMTSGPNSGPSLPGGQQPTWFVADHHVMERG